VTIQMELNIGLEVPDGPNSEALVSDRAAMALAWLSAFVVDSRRFETRYTGPAGEVVERSLFIRLAVDRTRAAIPQVYTLSSLLRQDCIAVYYPSRDSGLLIGPNAELWPAFDAKYFTRFQPTTEGVTS